MARVLIAGCGYLGSRLGERLANAGAEVVGLRRRPGALPAPIQPIAADLLDARSLARLPGPFDAVVYAASAVRFERDAYRAAYVEGPSHLVNALREMRSAPRFVFVSSTAVYGETDGAWVDEQSPARPAGFSGELLLEGESRVLDSGFAATVLRLGGIYGPGRDRLVGEVREGRARLSAGGPHYTNRIHVDDAAGAIALLLDVPKPPHLLLGVDHEPSDRNDLLRWIAERVGVDVPPVGDAPASPRTATNKRCRNAALLATGFRFEYPTFREGYAALIRPMP